MYKLVLATLLLLAPPIHAQTRGDGLVAFLKTKMHKERIPALQIVT